MSKFMKREDRERAINELMSFIRKNTECSKCIDVYENLLREIDIEDVVDTAVSNMNRFAGEFSRLCKDIDNMKQLDFISKMLTDEFIRPDRYFVESKKIAKSYLLMSDILVEMYNYKEKFLISNKNRLGEIHHINNYTEWDVANTINLFGNISNLSEKEIDEKYESARKVVLLYNYMPAIVKALIQTKRRSLNLDMNSKKFGK